MVKALNRPANAIPLPFDLLPWSWSWTHNSLGKQRALTLPSTGTMYTMYVYIYICVCICVYIYTLPETPVTTLSRSKSNYAKIVKQLTLLAMASIKALVRWHWAVWLPLLDRLDLLAIWNGKFYTLLQTRKMASSFTHARPRIPISCKVDIVW